MVHRYQGGWRVVLLRAQHQDLACDKQDLYPRAPTPLVNLTFMEVFTYIYICFQTSFFLMLPILQQYDFTVEYTVSTHFLHSGRIIFLQLEKQLGFTKSWFFSAPVLRQGIIALILAEPHPGGLTPLPKPNTTLPLNTALRLRNVGLFSSVASSGLQGSSKQTIFFQTLSRSANNTKQQGSLVPRSFLAERLLRLAHGIYRDLK